MNIAILIAASYTPFIDRRYGPEIFLCRRNREVVALMFPDRKLAATD